MSTFVLSLADLKATLETAGGKGMSLAKMAQSGLPVPGGFHVTTDAYRSFVDANGIQPEILRALQRLDITDSAGLESIAQEIGQYFMDGSIPPEIAAAVVDAYAALSKNAGEASELRSAGNNTLVPADALTPAAGLAVAVRSSATAEDLPGASFAGQQDTYLNICGAEAVLAAIKKCWASLWTARAIAYRARQNIAPETVALAVVVQELVFADASGVLFTANPVSGKRNELMITATWGLGEAIVGGLVTPDTLIVDKVTGRVLRRETSAKLVMTVRTAAGTDEQPVPPSRQKAPVLRDAQAAELAKLGAAIERLYGMPMDIEWTQSRGRFAIVQARPVTSLPEPPLVWERANRKSVMARGSFAEFVPDPISPLFATLGIPIALQASRELMMGFYGSETDNSFVMEVLNGYVYIGYVMTPGMVLKMMSAMGRQTKALLKTGRERWLSMRSRLCEVVETWQQDPSVLPAPRLLDGARDIFEATAVYYTVGQSGVIPTAPMSEMLFDRFYKALVKRKTDPATSTFMLGFDTLPLRAEKSLYDLALWVKDQPELAAYLQETGAEEIIAALQAETLPKEFAGRFSAHLAAFGHTLYDLDFAKPVPADDPAPVAEGLKAYLGGKGASPYERQRSQAERREQAEQAILTRLDPLRRKWFAKMLHWAQRCGPDREDCIADMGLGYPVLHRLLGELGRRLAAAGAIAQAGDIYWLELEEAEALAAGLETGAPLTAHHEKIEERKAKWQRARGATAPMALPEKSWMSKLMGHDNPEGSTLKGYAASAGKVTARACVLRGPDDFASMRPGDVIVAVTTTPAWTPLFAMASAVVTDIGGPLSHSSIVAREYGIPAVMATGVASRRIQNGQTITVDGSAGTVTLN